MDEHLGTAGTLSNLMHVCQTRPSLLIFKKTVYSLVLNLASLVKYQLNELGQQK